MIQGNVSPFLRITDVRQQQSEHVCLCRIRKSPLIAFPNLWIKDIADRLSILIQEGPIATSRQ